MTRELLHLEYLQEHPDGYRYTVRALKYFGGASRTTVSGQHRAAVSEPCRYEPGLHRTYAEFGRHYGMAVVPARPRAARPRRRARASRLDPRLERVRVLYAECRGNVVRVAEKLGDEGLEVGYSTLTAFCRRHGIGQRTKEPAGEYDFEPGEEMQHDTSPRTVEVGGRMRSLQCASLVLCYSRVLFAQCYPRF